MKSSVELFPSRVPLLTVVICLLSSLGCDGVTGLDADDLRFALVEVDGSAIPGAVAGGLEFLEGTFTLNGDGSCERSVLVDNLSADDPVLLTQSCTWSQIASEVRVTWSDESTTVGTLFGDRFTVTFETGIVCVTTPCPTQRIEGYDRVE